MKKEFLKSCDIKIEKRKFYYSKILVNMNNEDIDRIKISKKIYFGKKSFKYIIGYKNDKKVRLLCIILPKMRGYLKSCDKTKYISFLPMMSNC